MRKHVLTETNYCSTMYEYSPVEGRFRCTDAGRYMDAEGLDVSDRCAAGHVVFQLTDVPKLESLVDRLCDLPDDEVRAELRALVNRAPEVSS